jgi:hypothetical protein
MDLRRGHRDPWIAKQIERFLRAPHHAEHQLAVDDVRLAWADPRPAVGAVGAEDEDARLTEPFLGEGGELRRAGREFRPATQ